MSHSPERTTALRQLKDYLLFLRETGYREVPLESELLAAPRDTGAAGEGPTHTKETDAIGHRDRSRNSPGKDVAKDLDAIREELGDCRRCKLSGTRTHIVFGSGNPGAGLVFVGEGPGADEDEQGLPFVGRAGKKLTEIIEKGMGLNREKDTYICNIIKCRPPGNRDPEADEIAACQPFLVKQIQAIRPRVIVALGKPAASTLLGRRVAITRERGTWHEFAGIPLMLTFHPAYLLRAYTLENRRAVLDDMKQVLARLEQ